MISTLLLQDLQEAFETAEGIEQGIDLVRIYADALEDGGQDVTGWRQVIAAGYIPVKHLSYVRERGHCWTWWKSQLEYARRPHNLSNDIHARLRGFEANIPTALNGLNMEYNSKDYTTRFGAFRALADALTE